MPPSAAWLRMSEMELAGDELATTLRALGAPARRLPGWLHLAPQLPEEEDAPFSAAPPESLLDPALAGAVLGTALATTAHDGELWVEEAVRRIAMGRPFAGIPRRTRPTLRRGVQVLVDRGAAMLPFHADVRSLLAQVRSVFGVPLVRVLQFDGSPLRGAGKGSRRTWTAYAPQLPEPGTVIVAVTDLGIGDVFNVPGAPPPEWLEFAALAHRHGCPLRVMVPYPESRWPVALRGHLRILPWDRGTGVQRVIRALASERRAAGENGV
ncbi:MAG TPA: hypothetical protein VLK84_30805 [Longimicrobium sp.]|nr:hypothetical protein [Longimicrobium sp.]